MVISFLTKLPPISSTDYIFHNFAIIACKNGEINIVKHFIEKYYSLIDINYIAAQAIHEGHTEIFYYLIEKGANNYDLFMKEAAFSGSMNILKDMVNREVRDFHSAIEFAKTDKIKEYLRRFI